MRARWLLVVALLAATLIGGTAAFSQEDGGLSAEEQVLVEQFHAARVRYRTLDSLKSETVYRDVQEYTFDLGGQSQQLIQTIDFARQSQWIRGENLPNVTATLHVEIEDARPGIREPVSFGIDADVRVADDVVYVKAAYVESDPDLPTLPDGWAAVDPKEAPGVYDRLDLDDFLEEDTIADDLDLLLEVVASATMEETELDDGTPVQVITLTIDHEGLVVSVDTMVDSAPNPEMVLAMMKALSDESYSKMTVTVDADGDPVRYTSEILLDYVGMDAHALDPESFPEGMTLSLRGETSSVELFMDLNAPFEPVVAPELAE
jgi:hypothetical protein